jgi:gliding motility-associated-like protein
VLVDCNGDFGGTAFIDNCATCVGGNTGEVACVADCNGDFGGTAFIDNCATCVGGNTGEVACVADCNGDFGGTAFIDNCAMCVGGNTGEVACAVDCNGDFGGTAFLDNCAMCVGGNTGEVACVADCNGDFGGTAFLDNCATCVGGNTGLTACVADCNGDFGGTALGVWSGPSPIQFSDISSPNATITCMVPGSYELTWTVSIPGCVSTDQVVVNFLETPDASFNFAETVFCVDGEPMLPTTSSSGGEFSAPVGLNINNETGQIAPSGSALGTYLITHSFNGSCPTSASQTVVISETMDPSWSQPAAMCANEAPIQLSSLVSGDQGGIWSGTGVSGTTFDPALVSGSTELTYTVGSGTCTRSLTASLQVMDLPVADAGPDTAVCGLSYSMEGVLVVGTGLWTSLSPIVVEPDASLPNALISTTVPGTFELVWTVTHEGCTARDSTVITLSDPGNSLTVDAGPDQDLEVDPSTTLNAITSEGASIQWSLIQGSGNIEQPNSGSTTVDGLDIGTNIFIATVSIGQCIGASDTVMVRVKDFFIPQGFSPNGDGDNDRFEITGISAYPNSELVIFNRWGQQVYVSPDYTNDWHGQSNNGRLLENDTYFYVLNLSDGTAYNGFVVIKR